MPLGTAEEAALGGLASVAGGGKFADGAITGAFGYLFNAIQHRGDREEIFKEGDEGIERVDPFPKNPIEDALFNLATEFAPNRFLIVFASFTDLAAYGSTGIKWRTKRLTWDNLKITEVTDTVIEGEFWDIRSDAKAGFTVDLATGNHQGGIRNF